MVVGGNPTGQGDVEIINLSDDGKSCTKPPNLVSEYGGTGAYFEGFPLVCGGHIAGVTDKCYKYVLPVIIKRECSSSISKATSTDEDNIVVEVNSDESEFHDVELKQSDKEEKNSTKGKRYSLWPLH